MKAYILALAAAVIVSFVTGWNVNGWRLTSAHNAERVAEEQRQRELAEQMEQRIAAADADAQKELAAYEARLLEFERCISAGAGCGLRIKVRPAPACVPAGEAAGVGTGDQQFAELDRELGPDYRALRAGIVRLEQALKVCVRATTGP